MNGVDVTQVSEGVFYNAKYQPILGRGVGLIDSCSSLRAV
jgi:hypothetical protein